MAVPESSVVPGESSIRRKSSVLFRGRAASGVVPGESSVRRKSAKNGLEGVDVRKLEFMILLHVYEESSF